MNNMQIWVDIFGNVSTIFGYVLIAMMLIALPIGSLICMTYTLTFRPEAIRAKVATTTARDDVETQAYAYEQNHPDEKLIKIDFLTSWLGKDLYNMHLLDTLNQEAVSRVFYIDNNDKATSGYTHSYNDATRSNNLVYIFVTR